MTVHARIQPPPATQWITRAERRDSSLAVEFFGPTIAAFSGRIRNLSTSGMLIDTPHRLSVGDVLTARMPTRGDTLCRIVRVTSKGAGVRFLQQVDEDDAAEWD